MVLELYITLIGSLRMSSTTSLAFAIFMVCFLDLAQAEKRPPTRRPPFNPIYLKPTLPTLPADDYALPTFIPGSPDYDYRPSNKQPVRRLGGVGPLTVDKLYLDNSVRAGHVYVNQDYYNYDYPDYKNSYNYRDYPSYGKSGLGLVNKIRSVRHGKK
uniref:Uncharacterized protein n=1 Tax=Ditylenchus dipsaci TaxID=166011 RepID=A0A915EC43_9BILA